MTAELRTALYEWLGNYIAQGRTEPTVIPIPSVNANNIHTYFRLKGKEGYHCQRDLDGKVYIYHNNAFGDSDYIYCGSTKVNRKSSRKILDPDEFRGGIDIFDRIFSGLSKDYTDPDTNQVYRVVDYLSKRTKGVRVYTKSGKFLGACYPFKVYSDKSECKAGKGFNTTLPH